MNLFLLQGRCHIQNFASTIEKFLFARHAFLYKWNILGNNLYPINMNAFLAPLTGLRFLAASLIVIHHSSAIFNFQSSVNFSQAVSFFFVLSGFIMVYVYPSLQTKKQVFDFFKARVARIFPAHIFCLTLCLCLNLCSYDIKTGLFNILLVHSFIPMSNFYFSYNSVSWSISTEFIFYLFFPLIIYHNRKYLNFIFFTLIFFNIIYLASVGYLNLPEYRNPFKDDGGELITNHGLIYISPVCRIFEFVLGMATANFWLKSELFRNYKLDTFFEAFCFLICGISMTYSSNIAILLKNTFVGKAGSLYFYHCGSALFFALLILVMARGGGDFKIIFYKYLCQTRRDELLSLFNSLYCN